MLVHQFLERAAESRPDHVAIVHGAVRTTYAEVEELSNRIAHTLIGHGIARADRVAILVENSLCYVAAYYGILKAGAITVPLFPSTTERALSYTLNHCGARAMVTTDRSTGLLEKCLQKPSSLSLVLHRGRMPPRGLPSLTVLDWDEVEQTADSSRPKRGTIDIDVASILYTSGSTGRPKGATLSHLNIVTNTRSIVAYAQLTGDDSIMVVMPFPYVFAKSLLNTHFFAGGTVVLDNRFVFPNAVLETMHQEQVTGFAGVPSVYATLLNRSSFGHQSWDHLRYVMQAGGALAPALIERLMGVLPNTDIFIMYGATEASARLSYLPPADLARKLGSIGKAIPNVELKIIKDDGTEASLGQIGEIVARGANIMLGYWNDPEETQRVLDDRGYRTGDLGYVDEDGYFYVVGRIKETIKVSGYRVSPKEVEETILEHSDVHEVAVIGIPDEALGERICAYVVRLQEGVDRVVPLAESDVVRFCRQRLPAQKVPSEVRFVSELPKSNAGKIQKHVLRAGIDGLEEAQ